MNTDPSSAPSRDLRNVLAAAIHDGPSAVLELQKTGAPPHPWEACRHQATYLGDADALIAAPGLEVALSAPSGSWRGAVIDEVAAALGDTFSDALTERIGGDIFDRLVARGVL